MPVAATGGGGVLRYATAQSWEVPTVAAGATVAPFDFTSGSSYVDDPDGLFSPHANVITIPSSWVAETGACIAIVTFGIMVGLAAPGSATNGCAVAQLWVFSGYSVAAHESIVLQSTKGYRELQDADAADMNPSLNGSIQLDALSAGMVIELDLLNLVVGSGLLVNAAIFSSGYFSPAFLGIVKVADAA